MDKETLPPDNPPETPELESNVRLNSPVSPEIPERLRRELERDRPRARLPRGARAGRDARRSTPIDWKKPVIVTVAVLGLFALWAFWPAPKFDVEAQERWVQLCEDYEQWYQPFVSGLDETDLIALRGLDLIDAQANIGIYNFDPRYIAGNRGATYADLAANPPSSVRTEAGVAKTRAASSSIERLLIAFDQWPVHVDLKAHLKVIEAHGWDRAAKRVREVLKDAPPRGRASLTESLHGMIETEGRTSVIADSASQLDRDIAVLERVNDPVLQHFRDTVAALTDSALPPGPADDQHLKELGDALQPLAAFGERLYAIVESPDWQNVDYEGFRAEGEAYAMLQDPALNSNVVFREWLDEVQRYFAMTYDWRPTWARDMRQQLAGVTEHAEQP